MSAIEISPEAFDEACRLREQAEALRAGLPNAGPLAVKVALKREIARLEKRRRELLQVEP